MKKSWIITPIVAVVLGVIGVASATVLATDGTASVTGAVGTLSPVTGTGTLVNDVWPGHNNDCSVTFSNPNSVDVKVGALTVTSVTVTGTGPGANATYTASELAGYTAFGTFENVDAGGAVVPAHNTDTVTISNCLEVPAATDLSAYQGDGISISYSVAYQSN